MAKIMFPIGSIEVDDKVALVVRFDWFPDWKSEVEAVEEEVNDRLKSGTYPAFLTTPFLGGGISGDGRVW